MFVLYQKYMIDGYYDAQQVVGVFSTLEKAEAAIDRLDAEAHEKSEERYKDYIAGIIFDPAFYEQRKKDCEESLLRKEEGSNSWRKTKEALNHAISVLENFNFPKPVSFEEYVSWFFNREDYTIEEVEIDTII